MAKIQLSTRVTLDITENGKVVDTFKISFREPSKRQQREIGKENEEILDLFKKSQSLDRRLEVTEAKVSALKELENAKELLTTAKSLDKLYIDRDNIEDRFIDLGGFEKMLEASRLTFDHAISGEDKDRLRDFIEDQSDYSIIMGAIAEDAKEQRGK